MGQPYTGCIMGAVKRIKLVQIWVSATCLVVTCGLLLLYRTGLPPEVPLWYSRPWGQDQLSSPYWLWLIPVVIAVMTGLGWLGHKWLRRENLLANLWLLTTLLVEVVLAISVVRIVWLVVF